MEYAKYSLRDIIQEKRNKHQSFTNEELANIAQDLLEHLFFLHANSIVHFDIKPQNILYIEFNKSYILADFGVSAEFNKDDLALVEGNSFVSETSIMGTPLYMSPAMKCSIDLGKYLVVHDPFKSDVYSLGLVFAEMISVNVITEEEFKSLITGNN